MAEESHPKRFGSSTLLPPSSTLMPPSNDGSLLTIGHDSGQDLSAGLDRAGAEAKELALRAGAEARELASKAAALAAEKAPELRKKAHDLASRAAREAEAASEILADSGKRHAFFAAHKQKIGIGLTATLLVVGGGWLYAKHQATLLARDQIDGFLIRNNLSSVVSFADVSASPFGSVELSGFSLRIAPNHTILTAETVVISNLDTVGSQVRAVTLSAKGLEVPLLALVRAGHRGSLPDQLIGLGYTTLTGDVSIGGRFDDQHQTLSVELKGDMSDFVSWNSSVKIGNVTPAAGKVIYGLIKSAAGDNSLLQTLSEVDGLQAIAQTTLVSANLSIDNSGYMKRLKKIPDTELPPDGASTAAQTTALNEADLVRAGMLPSQAKAAREALQGWEENGGPLRIETNFTTPIPLFRPEGRFGIPAFAFSSSAAFIAATNAKVSN